MPPSAHVRWSVRIAGVVQGVGFRPYVHHLAHSMGLDGLVGNDDAGVFVEVEGSPDQVRAFVERLPVEAPASARIDSVTVHEMPPQHRDGFDIVASRDTGGSAVTLIPPDTAVCEACLAEIADPLDRRYRYPFTACTYCGPRYTIVTGLPYDRPFTTMSKFPLCEACAREYADPTDRRFHAQPTACPVCGPRLWFRTTGASTQPATQASVVGDHALAAAMRVLADGGIVAIKGIGGYHLACDARQPAAVAVLRERKQRGDKPFAVMVRDLDAAQRLVRLTDAHRTLLASPQAPIVLVAVGDGASTKELAHSVAPHNGHVGVMLPYSPLHKLLFTPHPGAPDLAFEALVMTSGNLADEPICTDPAEADERLAGIADAWLHHDRGIHVACDDSVVRAMGDQLLPIRRSRGYAPLPVMLPVPAPAVLAVGGELKTTVCLAQGRHAWLSQHIGDTAHVETLELLARTARTVAELARITPEVVVADAHPGYLSRRWAQEHARAAGAGFVTVQHHHAHLASLLAEWGVSLGEQVLGVTFDGTGFGMDGTIWGGELLLGDYRQVARVGHVRPIPLPGGDAAIRRPARVGLAHLAVAGIPWAPDLPPVAAADDVERRVLATMVASSVGCTPTTSMGRLFDAVASLLGVCQDADYEGQAAIELEALAAAAAPSADDSSAWAWQLTGGAYADDPLLLDPAGSLAAGVAAVRSGVESGRAALAFHEAVADAVLAAAVRVRDVHGTSTVGLTGGVFQNAVLTRACTSRLERTGFVVLTHRTVPPNDGGLALGQVAVVAAGGGE